MDVESGKCTAGRRLPKLIIAVSAFLSCIAMTGVFLLALQNQNLQTEVEDLQQLPQDTAQDTAQRKIAQREVSKESLSPPMPIFIYTHKRTW